MTAEVVYNILFGDPSGSKESDIKIIQEYARIEIENDRERVIEKLQAKLDSPNEILWLIDNTPITLD